MPGDDLPKVISLSSDAVKMFRAVAKEETGGESESNIDKPFATISQAFLCAAALGIVTNSRREVKEKKQWLTRREYFEDKDAYKSLRQLLRSKFDLKTEREVLDLVIAYAEGGIRELYDEYRKTGEIDFLRISKLA